MTVDFLYLSASSPAVADKKKNGNTIAATMKSAHVLEASDEILFPNVRYKINADLKILSFITVVNMAKNIGAKRRVESSFVIVGLIIILSP